MTQVTGKEIHGEAESIREKGAFLDALQLTDEAIIKYEEEKNVIGLTDIIASRSITLRLLFQKTLDRSFLILGKHECMAAVEIAKKSTEPSSLVMPLYRLAQIQEDLSEFEEAVTSYEAALRAFHAAPPAAHNRPAVFFEMKIRAEICAYRAGNKSLLPDALATLSKLEETKELPYNKDVWVSGALMKLAEVLKTDDSLQARQYLLKAKQIIDANPELILRKAQWEALAATFPLS